MEKYIILFMIFAHIFDDYYLQGILSKLKQKSFWVDSKNYPSELQGDKQKKYKYDYIPALIIHSLSWSFMILLPLIIFYSEFIIFIYVAFIMNALIHAVVDHLKANLYKINLIQDQSIHFIQILLTYCIFILVS